MARRRRDPEGTRVAILTAARRLLAEQDFSTVSIRDIAAAAGVSHGVVQHHFGTRRQLIAAIIQAEVQEFHTQTGTAPSFGTKDDQQRWRTEFKEGMAHFHDFALLITRAELAGEEPENLLNPNVATPAQLLADAIREQQGTSSERLLDPALVAAYVNAATFAFAILSPWLLAAAGVEPSEMDTHMDQIADITMALIAVSTG